MIRIVLLFLLIALALSAREPRQITLANQGTIAGMYLTRFRTKRIAAYVGIPYAQPPIDFRRFTAPEYTDLPQWEGIKNATIYAPDCMQSEPKREDVLIPWHKHDELFSKLLDAQLEEPRKKEISEDCLYLNVYVPDDFKVEGYPTMVYFHGGDFVRGSPQSINPFQLVLKQKVIFVTVAYRLNIFGFFSTLDNEAPGNFGLLDQAAALQWVQNNIESFGGDPNNICIFGHDAGAVSVGLHLVSSYSAGLYQKAIAMSGNVLSPETVNIARKELVTVDKVASAFSCFRKPTHQLLECLRRVNSQALLDLGEPLAEWKPIVDAGFSNTSSPFLPELPSKLFKDKIFSAVPVLTGYTNMEDALLLHNEGDESGISQREYDIMREEVVLSDITVDNSSCFTNQHHIQDAVAFFYKPIPPTSNETILRKLFLDFYTDKVHGATTYQLAKHLCEQAPVYLYRFDLKPFSDIANEGIPEWIGVPHNFDQIFVFGLPHLALPKDLDKWDYRDKSISEIIMKMWSNFAWYSNPTNSGVIIDWEPFEIEKPGYLIIDRQNFTMSTSETINYKAFEFWTDFYPKVVEIGTKCCKEVADDSGTDSIIMSLTLVSGQRPSFAGSRPIGFPEVEKTTTEGLGNRFGEDDVSTTTIRLPIEANGDRDLVDRLSKLPVDQQPFWFINWQAYEAHRQKPQTFPQKPNVFVDPLSNQQPTQQNFNQQTTGFTQQATSFSQAPTNFNQATTSFNRPPTNVNQVPVSSNQANSVLVNRFSDNDLVSEPVTVRTPNTLEDLYNSGRIIAVANADGTTSWQIVDKNVVAALERIKNKQQLL
ncbi:fatty acyl-CoA hydrolase precursor, medium chain [Ostrinia nubilalis]|uniref:fatty acyl-CoA hydrolase precursor, medium chain n=1 Tax=Ostrinia nubilalis TaxID=29057 RepID=UPI0030825D12